MEDGGLFVDETLRKERAAEVARGRAAFPKADDAMYLDVALIVARAHPDWITALDVAIGLGKVASSAVVMKNFVGPALRALVDADVLQRVTTRSAYRYALSTSARTAWLATLAADGDASEGKGVPHRDASVVAVPEVPRPRVRRATKEMWRAAVAECYPNLPEMASRIVAWSAKLKAKPGTLLDASKAVQAGGSNDKRRRERARHPMMHLCKERIMVESEEKRKERRYRLGDEGYARVMEALNAAFASMDDKPSNAHAPATTSPDAPSPPSTNGIAHSLHGRHEGDDTPTATPPAADAPTVEAARRVIVAMTQAKRRRDAYRANLESLRSVIETALEAGVPPDELAAGISEVGLPIDVATLAGFRSAA